MLSAKSQFHFKSLRQRKRLFGQNLPVLLWLSLICIVSTPAQTSNWAESVVVIYNVRIANCEKNRLVNATVSVSGGKIMEIDAETIVPDDAILIDGGGNILMFDADGRIVLRWEKGGAVLKNLPKPQEVTADIFLASGARYQNKARLYMPDLLNSGCRQDRARDGELTSRNNLNSREFKGKLFDTNDIPSFVLFSGNYDDLSQAPSRRL